MALIDPYTGEVDPKSTMPRREEPQDYIVTNEESWDEFFLGEARNYSRRSKDPSTKVGAVIVRPDNTPASHGFNGLPRGVGDWASRLHNRELKYKLTVHAEINAIAFSRENLDGYTLYVWPIPPCVDCAGPIINSGIKRIVSPQANERWGESCDLAKTIFEEAGVEVCRISY